MKGIMILEVRYGTPDEVVAARKEELEKDGYTVIVNAIP